MSKLPKQPQSSCWKVFLAFFIASFCFLPVPASGQGTPAGTAVVPPSKFPALYRGDDARAVYFAFEKRQPSFEKSEFETSQQYVTRVRAIMAGMVLGNSKTAADELIYITDAFDQSYDADTQTLTVKVDFASYATGSQNDAWKSSAFLHAYSVPWGADLDRFGRWKTIELSANERSHGSVVGTTAFGTKKRVAFKSYTSTYLAMHSNAMIPAHTFKIALSVERGRQINDSIYLAISGTAMYPFIAKEQDQDTPTLTSPEASFYFKFYLFLNPRTLSLYDFRTGEILGSTKLQLVPPAPPPVPSAPIPEGAVVIPLKFISKPNPVYTPAARKNNIQGTVTLRITFLASGEVGDILPLQGLPDGLTEQAIAAAKQIVFEPQKVNGVPQTVTKLLTYSFSQY